MHASSSSVHLSPLFKPQRAAAQSSPSLPDVSARKRNSRRVVLTGAEGLNLDDIFPPTPRPASSPPTVLQLTAQAALESPLDSIPLRFSPLGLYSNVPTSPSSSRSARSPSPTPSVASVASASTVSSAASIPAACANVLTPPTSDDECTEMMASRLARAPKVKSQRGTIGYVPGARKNRSASEKSVVDLDLSRGTADADDANWFAQDISDAFILVSELEFVGKAAVPRTPALPPVQASGRSRFSKPLPSVPRFSIQVRFFIYSACTFANQISTEHGWSNP